MKKREDEKKERTQVLIEDSTMATFGLKNKAEVVVNSNDKRDD